MNKIVTLYFCIDQYGHMALPLITGPLREIDSYTTKFSNSSEIKEKYKFQIENFKNENSDYIKSIESRTGTKETGDIAIIEKSMFQKKVEKTRITVLYAKHIVAFKQIIYMQEFYDILNVNHQQQIDELRKNPELLNTSIESYFDFIRKIYALYKTQRTELGLPTPETIYKDHLKRLKEKVTQDYVQLPLFGNVNTYKH